jgi:predicted RNA-binding protein
MEEHYAHYKSLSEVAADNKRYRVDCEIWGAGSYPSHLESKHNVFQSMVLQREIMVDCPHVIYHAIK